MLILGSTQWRGEVRECATEPSQDPKEQTMFAGQFDHTHGNTFICLSFEIPDAYIHVYPMCVIIGIYVWFEIA